MRSTVFNTALLLDRLTAILPIFVYSYGVLILFARIILPGYGLNSRSVLLGLTAAGVLFLVVDVCFSRGKWYSSGFAASWYELHNHAGGLILTGDPGAIKNIRVTPRLSLRPLAKAIILPCLFVLAAFMIPSPEPKVGISSQGIRQAVEALQARVENAAEMDILPEPEAEALAEQLRQIEAMAENTPEAAAEALSMMPAKIDSAIMRQIDKGLDAQEKAQRFAAQTEAEGGASTVDAEKAGQELREAFETLQAEANPLSNEMRQAFEEAMRAAKEGEGRQSALSGEGNESSGQTEARRGSEGSGGTESGNGGERKSGREQRERLSQLLQRQNQQNLNSARECGVGADMVASAENRLTQLGSLGDAMDALMSGGEGGEATGLTPGSGGVTRGRADAPLSFGNEAPASGERFAYKALPVAEHGALPGMLVDEERVQPGGEALPPEEFRAVSRRAGAVPDVLSAGENAPSLSPSRARVAERYFRDLNSSGGR